MSRSFSVVLVRHGHTEYTGVFPDITSEGERSLIQTAAQITEFASGRKIIMFCSPKARAHGSALCLATALDLKPSATILTPIITAMEQRQPDRVMQLVEKYLSSTDPLAVDKAYWTEPEFDDSETVEPRAAVKERFYKFLDRLVCGIGLSYVESPGCYVCVSHAEVIGHIVQDVQSLIRASINPVVLCAQPVFLTFTREDDSQPIYMDYRFAGVEVKGIRYGRLRPK